MQKLKAPDSPNSAMRSLFTSGFYGSGYSSAHIKETIKKLIAEEDNSAPITDTDLATAIARSGMPVSRR